MQRRQHTKIVAVVSGWPGRGRDLYVTLWDAVDLLPPRVLMGLEVKSTLRDPINPRRVKDKRFWSEGLSKIKHAELPGFRYDHREHVRHDVLFAHITPVDYKTQPFLQFAMRQLKAIAEAFGQPFANVRIESVKQQTYVYDGGWKGLAEYLTDRYFRRQGT